MRLGQSPDIILTQRTRFMASCELRTAPSRPSMRRAQAQGKYKEHLLMRPPGLIPPARSRDFTLMQPTLATGLCVLLTAPSPPSTLRVLAQVHFKERFPAASTRQGALLDPTLTRVMRTMGFVARKTASSPPSMFRVPVQVRAKAPL